MQRPNHPLGEVFGHSPTDFSGKAVRFRKYKLCPFNNKIPNCTKDKAKDPLGVCSVSSGDKLVITCPVRFREHWLIAEDAADFFFEENAMWTSLTEVRMADQEGKSAGNIDMVLVAYDEQGRIYDFGALEIQAVYISGNIRDPFARYMSDCQTNALMDWRSEPNYPRPDFLSSSRKRLAPQLFFKGGILHAWNKKMAVALDTPFFETLPQFEEVDKSAAEVAWLVYDLVENDQGNGYQLRRARVLYSRFLDALNTITKPKVGRIEDFLKVLQSKVDEKLESPPITQNLENPFGAGNR